jgi:MoaA/NifB/PqqE/SkfB family radical SAM enzyme
MQKTNYYSNELKLLGHVEKLKRITTTPRPIDMVISLTGKCNCHCPFCYVSGEKPRWNQDVDDIKKLITIVRPMAVEISGGEATLHPDLDSLVEWIARMGTEVALTTNGTLLHEHTKILNLFSWVRVSINVYIHGDRKDDTLFLAEAQVPETTTYGYNYVYNNFQPFSMDELVAFMARHPRAEYIRIAPDINSTDDEIVEFIKIEPPVGGKIFKSILPIHKPYDGQCYCGWIKPMVESNGNIYPCFRILADGCRDKAIPIGNISDPTCLLKFKEFVPHCEKCYLYARNEFIDALVKGMKHGNFV